MTTRMLIITFLGLTKLVREMIDEEKESDNPDDVDESGQIVRLKTWRVFLIFLIYSQCFVILNLPY